MELIYTMDHAQLFLILAAAFGFFMAWGIGANDVANAMGTSVGSKALTFKQAMIVAAVFEASGSLLAGGQVTDTIRKHIIDVSVFHGSPEVLIYGMLAALLAAGMWLLIASYFGWPVSTTHSIVGAIIGFALVVLGPQYIYWGEVFNITMSWVITPLISGVTAYLIFKSIQRLIFSAENPVQNARNYLPIYIFGAAMVVSLITFTTGLKHLHVKLTLLGDIGASFTVSFLIMLVGFYLLRRLPIRPSQDLSTNYAQVEKIFGILMIFTACSMAFAHGSNDVANAIGPLAAIVSIVESAGKIGSTSTIPFWVMLIGAGGIVLGLATYGYRVIRTIGTQITELTPSRGFSAELATATTVVVASGLGLPISTTQTLVGAVLGVGFARGIAALNLGVIRNIFLSWIITLPAGAGLAIIFYYLLTYILPH